MYIQFLIPYDENETGKIIKTNGIKGRLLCKRGIAHEQDVCYLVDDIIVGQYVNYDENGELIRSHYSLFKYINESPINEIETGMFLDLVSGEEYMPTNHIGNTKTPHVPMIDGRLKYKIHEFEKLDRIVKRLNLKKDDYISRETLLDIHEVLCPILENQKERPYTPADSEDEMI